VRINVIIAGHKAHASCVFKEINKVAHVRIVGVFTDRNDKFCILDEKTISELAERDGIKVYDAESLNRPTLEKINKDAPIHFLIFAEWRCLIEQSVFTFPVYGSYNIHDSLLPKYRGSSPMNWAMINGEGYTGVTFYRIENRADSGDIFSQIRIPIEFSDYAMDVLYKVTEAYGDAVVSGINAVLNQDTPIKQSEEKATYCAKRIPEDGLLNFNEPIVSIYNKIRALSCPFPGAFAFYKGRKTKINRASIMRKTYKYIGFIPGYLLNSESVLVLCKEGILCIAEIEVVINGKKVTDPKKFFTDKTARLVSTE